MSAVLFYVMFRSEALERLFVSFLKPSAHLSVLVLCMSFTCRGMTSLLCRYDLCEFQKYEYFVRFVLLKYVIHVLRRLYTLGVVCSRYTKENISRRVAILITSDKITGQTCSFNH